MQMFYLLYDFFFSKFILCVCVSNEILVFDKDLKEYYNDEIGQKIELYNYRPQPKELNYLCELVPVRFDSDSLTFTQKSPVRYELSLNFKEIIKE